MTPQDRMRGCLLGLAVGDALGATNEFKSRGTFRPVTGIVGGGPFDLQPGQWTDDTAMAMCLGTSLVESDGFDPDDIMERFVRWYQTGYWSSTGTCFDIGHTTRIALDSYILTGNLWGKAPNERSGNGCIMRLAPVPIFYYPNTIAALEYAEKSAMLTHDTPACRESTRLLTAMLLRAFTGSTKDYVLDAGLFLESTFEVPMVKSVAHGTYKQKSIDAIHGTGFVVACLEAAAYCFATTTTFSDAVLMAANLGDDADTTAAVTGQLAGAFYGVGAIPSAWLAQLARADDIEELADDLME